jgi:UDP-N-acetylglucosamine transferase subunit ALG13
MIFVTVGDALPFDRLVLTVDQWAKARGRTDVFAQIGASITPPSFIQWTDRLDPREFQSRMRDADVIIAHAGMGTILSALSLGKPVLVFPRRGDLKETRNDHQVATVRRFSAAGMIAAAETEAELIAQLDRLTELIAFPKISPVASPTLVSAVNDFICKSPVDNGFFGWKGIFRQGGSDGKFETGEQPQASQVEKFPATPTCSVSKICLVASAGGHMTQLLILSKAWEGRSVVWITSQEVGTDRLRKQGPTYVVGEGNRNQPLKIITIAWRCCRAVWRERPTVVLSTGAAPGLIACVVGRLVGARVIWVDSIANTKRLSMSGRFVRPFADLVLSQWPEVAAKMPGVEYAGEVI